MAKIRILVRASQLNVSRLACLIWHDSIWVVRVGARAGDGPGSTAVPSTVPCFPRRTQFRGMNPLTVYLGKLGSRLAGLRLDLGDLVLGAPGAIGGL